MDNYKDIIRQISIPIGEINKGGIEAFKWLSNEVYSGKNKLKSNSVEFIIIKILNNKGNIYTFQRKPSFDVYIIGDFRKPFMPTLKVAEAFANFYLEMKVLPKIIAIPKHRLNKELLSKFRGGVLLYERG